MHINSVLNTFTILKAFLGRERSMTLKAISQHARMPPSKAHRYLHSLITCGMVSQDFATGRYALGPMAVEYGLVGLAKIDPVRRTCQAAVGLAAELDVAAAVAVFSLAGPVFVTYEEPMSGIRCHVSIGASASMVSSSTGHVFLAYLERDRMLEHVRSTAALDTLRGVDLDGLIHRVRNAGYATESAAFGRPVYGLSAPVFNALGEICAALTLFSYRADLLDPANRSIRMLLEETRRLSLAGGEALRAPDPGLAGAAGRPAAV